MTRLARAEPGFSQLGPLTDGSAASDAISVNRWNLEALSVNEKHIQPDSIATGMIQIGAVGTDELAAGAVGTTTIADGAINTDKLQALAVTAAKIAADTITGDKIATNAITSGEINAGAVISGKISVSNLADINTLFAGSITISAASGGGEPTTGVYITSTRILMKQSSVVKVDLNAGAGTYYFKGEVVADKVTIVSNSENSVTFGADITIGGDIVMNAGAVDGRVRFDGAGGNAYLDYDSSVGGYPLFGIMFAASVGAVGFAMGDSDWTHLLGTPSVSIQDGTINISNTGSYGPNSTTRDINVAIGSNSGNLFSLKRGSTTVLSFPGNASTVTLLGDLAMTGDIGCDEITCTSVRGDHYSSDATQGVTSSPATFYVGLSDGGTCTVAVSLVIKDGLITQVSFTP